MRTHLFTPATGVVQITAGGGHACALFSSGAPFCWGENSRGEVGDATQTDRHTPVAVPSFTLNIDPAVRLRNNSRVTTVNIIATCAEGGHLHVNVTVSQGSASAFGVGQGECTGRLEKYPVTVPAQGRDEFSIGAARVEAEADIRDRGAIIDLQQWTRQVTIVAVP